MSVFEKYYKINLQYWLVIVQSIEELEKEMLNGQKLQGPQTASEVYKVMKTMNISEKE